MSDNGNCHGRKAVCQVSSGATNVRVGRCVGSCFMGGFPSMAERASRFRRVKARRSRASPLGRRTLTGAHISMSASTEPESTKFFDALKSRDGTLHFSVRAARLFDAYLAGRGLLHYLSWFIVLGALYFVAGTLYAHGSHVYGVAFYGLWAIASAYWITPVLYFLETGRMVAHFSTAAVRPKWLRATVRILTTVGALGLYVMLYRALLTAINVLAANHSPS